MTPILTPSLFTFSDLLHLPRRDWGVDGQITMKPEKSESRVALKEDSNGNLGVAETSELLGRIANKDADALAELYDAHAGLLMTVIMAILKDKAESEDILQDSYLAIWNKAEMYSTHVGKPTSWMATIAKNKAYDRYRKLVRKSKGMVILKDNWGLKHESVEVAPQGENEELLAGMNDLNEDQRKAIELVFYEGLTQQEAADKLEAPLGTVKARIRRGLLKLKECITKH